MEGTCNPDWRSEALGLHVKLQPHPAELHTTPFSTGPGVSLMRAAVLEYCTTFSFLCRARGLREIVFSVVLAFLFEV